MICTATAAFSSGTNTYVWFTSPREGPLPGSPQSEIFTPLTYGCRQHL